MYKGIRLRHLSSLEFPLLEVLLYRNQYDVLIVLMTIYQMCISSDC